jgi:hypothetical protein
MTETGGVTNGGADSAQGGSQGGEAPMSNEPFPRGPHAPTDGEMVVLYNGNGFGNWEGVRQAQVDWDENPEEGYMQVVPLGGNDIITNSANRHEDVFLHIEWWSPDEPPNQQGQDRGNSGVYLQSMFELQVLDSYGRQPEPDGCGAIYGVTAPLVVACYPPEEWNTYEILFTAPRYDGENRIANPRLTVWLNDILIHDDVSVDADVTRGGRKQPPGPAPLMLQDHSDTVRYRNIWWIHLNK